MMETTGRKKQMVHSDKLEPVRRKYTYSHAIKAGNAIYLSGQVSRDRDHKVCHKRDFVGQMELVFENMKNVLEASGATMQDVVKLNFFCRSLRDLTKMTPIYEKYFGEHIPAMTAVEVVQLWNPHFLVEVEAIAVVNEGQTVIEGRETALATA
jgi:2-iminobutanoate/2-iminopropanoate deaminase